MFPEKKKKVDRIALNSAFMKIPRMKIEVARCFLDIGLEQVYELTGRAPEILFEELVQKQPETPKDYLPYFKMAVYYSETTDPDPKLMHPSAW